MYKTLRARIELINQAIGHTATQGAETESDVRALLTSVLPPCYGIGTGKIVGLDGETSNQIDVIVYDTTRPNYLLSSDSKLFLADHVVAAIEVKTTFTSGKHSSLTQALDNCQSVKRLRVCQRHWHEVFVDPETGKSEIREYMPFPPLAVAFFFGAADTQESRNIGGFFSTLKDAVDAYPVEEQPDLLFSLDHASFFRHADLNHKAHTAEYFSALVNTEDTQEPIRLTGASKLTKAIVDLAETQFVDGLQPSHGEIANKAGTSKAFVLTGGKRIPTDPLVLRVGRIDDDRFFLLDPFRAFLMFIHSLESLIQTKTMSKTWSVSDYFGDKCLLGNKYPDDFNQATASSDSEPV